MRAFMTKVLLLVSALLVGAGPARGEQPAPAPAAPPEPDLIGQVERFQKQLFAKAAPAVVSITRGDVIGSGFIVSESGLIVTNRHVVGDVSTVHVTLYDGRKLAGLVIERAQGDIDLALIKVRTSGLPVLPLGGVDDLAIGSWVSSIGHGLGGVWTFTTGMVSNIYPDEHEQPIIQTQIPLNPGNSGGPILDRQGRAVAIVTSGVMGANSINFSLRVDLGFKYLRGLTEHCDCLVVSALRGSDVSVDGTVVGQGPRVLLSPAPGTYKVSAQRGRIFQEVTITYPDTRHVDLQGPQGKASPKLAALERVTVSRLELGPDTDLIHAVDVVTSWIGFRVKAKPREGAPIEGRVSGIRESGDLVVALDTGARLTTNLTQLETLELMP